MRRVFVCAIVAVALSMAITSGAIATERPTAPAAPVATFEGVAQSAVFCTPILAQYQEERSGGSTRIRTRGIGKLIGLIAAVVIGVGGWIAKKVMA